jgi:hypothetical protein
MEAYEVYRLYMALKLHFTTESYDITKTKGAVKASESAFLKRRDVFLFRKLAKKFVARQEIINYFVANFAEGDKNGGIFNADSDDIYEKWKGRQDRLSYMFADDISRLLLEAEKSEQDPFVSVSNQHPILIKMLLGKKISLETVIILDKLLDFRYNVTTELLNDFIWTDLNLLIIKYRPFVRIDRAKFSQLWIKEKGQVVC